MSASANVPLLAAPNSASKWIQTSFSNAAYEGSLVEGELGAFCLPRLNFGIVAHEHDQWDVLPEGDENFLAYLAQATNIRLSPLSWRERVVDIRDFQKIYKMPFLFMTSEGGFRLKDDEISALAEFLHRGGFIYADDCVAKPNGDLFYRAFLREMGRIFPNNPMRPVSSDHEIYHCFYDIPGRSPIVLGIRNPDMGLFLEDRMAVFLTCCDVHCGWFGGVLQPYQESCFQMGVNIVVYALTH